MIGPDATPIEVWSADFPHTFRNESLFGNLPKFSQPNYIGKCSVNKQTGKLFLNDDYLSRYLPAHRDTIERGNVDLNDGYTEYLCPENIKKEDDTLWNWLSEYRKSRPIDPCDFVCYRGTLTTLSTTPYESSNDWKIAAIAVGSKIFLCWFQGDAASSVVETSEQKLFCYWGLRFEGYMTERSSSPFESSFLTVMTSTLEDLRLLYAAEMDCHDNDGQYLPVHNSGRPNFVELKTHRTMAENDVRRIRSYKRYKLLKCWTQCYLAGVLHLVMGFRDDKGIVRCIKNYSLPQLFHEACGEDRLWEPTVCMNFLYKFLYHVQRLVRSYQSTQNSGVFVFDLKLPNRGRGRSNISVYRFPTSSEFYFLPKDFTL